VFGKKRHPVVDPDLALAPFEIANPDPRMWVPIPLRFPTPQDQDFFAWEQREAKLFVERYPGKTTKDATRCYAGITAGRHKFSGHAAYWGLRGEDSPDSSDSLPLVFDVDDTRPDSRAAFEARLTAGSDETFAARSQHYHEQEAAPAQILPIEAAGLGEGVCVIRRDRHETLMPELENLLAKEDRRVRAIPDYWDLSMSIHCMFTVGDKDLFVSTRTDDLDLLNRSLPRIFELLDAISLPGRPSRSVDPDLREAFADLVSEMVADRHAEETQLIEELQRERTCAHPEGQ
jgi:hypothetical protein